jgi:tRNA threonylcarbamoyl adenosine modification protein YjeE
MPETIHLEDDDATAGLGVRLANALRPGDLVLLSGGLGAGKSALARAVIRSLMSDPALEVPSPSFALVQPYASTPPVIHADLYRLTGEREVDELGLFDRPDAIVLVEWPERAPGLADRATLTVALNMPKAGGRSASVAFTDNRVF